MEAAMNKLGKGMNTDIPVEYTTDGFHTFALNMVNTSDRGVGVLSNELGNTLSVHIPNMRVIGYQEVEDDKAVLFLVSEDDLISEIGLYNHRDDSYKTLITDAVEESKLNFSLNTAMSTYSRIIRGCEKVVYFTDNLNPPRSINLDRIKDYYKNGKLIAENLSLQKSVSSIPEISIKVHEGDGNLKSGQYMVGLQYWSDGAAASDFISLTTGAIIYKDSLTQNYDSIKGSSYSEEDTYHSSSDSKSNKSLHVSVSGIDSKFDAYRLVFLCANNSSGSINQVLLSDVIPVERSSFVFTGDNYKETITLGEVVVDTAKIKTAKVLNAYMNRLLLGNIKEESYRWHLLQQYANRIESECVVRKVNVTDKLEGSYKDPEHKSKDIVGYTPGEIYSFGIVYVLADGTESPVFHIPGSSVAPKHQGNYPMSDNNTMEYQYTKKWFGDLYLQDVKHHRFPDYKDLGISPFEYNTTLDSENRELRGIVISYKNKKATHYDPQAMTEATLHYTIGDESYDKPIELEYGEEIIQSEETLQEYIDDAHISLTDTLTAVSLSFTYRYKAKEKQKVRKEDGSVVEEDVDVEKSELVYVPMVTANDKDYSPFLSGDSKLVELGISEIKMTLEKLSYEQAVVRNNDIVTNSLGIEFTNIVAPPLEFTEGNPVVGYYIVRNERSVSDRTIIDQGVLFPTIYADKYIASGLLLPESNPLHTAKVDDRTYSFYSVDQKLDTIDYSGVSEIEFLGSYSPFITKYGLYLQNDVQDGSTKTDKDAVGDDDGWDLATFSRNNYVTYNPNYDFGVNSVPSSSLEFVREVNALENVEHEKYKIYNIAVDNKTVLVRFKEDTVLYDKTNRNVPYCILKSNKRSSYSNYSNSPFFRQHSSMKKIGDRCIVFSGDHYVVTANYHNHIFYDNHQAYRPKKHNTLKIIAAFATAVIGTVGAIFTGGTSLVVAGGILASLGAGAVLLASGIRHINVAKALVEEYQKGLRKTTMDFWVTYWTQTNKAWIKNEDLYSEKIFRSRARSQFRKYDDYYHAGTDGFDDDTIRWFVDVVSNMYVGSSHNLWLRSELNSNIPSYIPLSSSIDEPNRSRLMFYYVDDGRDPEADYISSVKRSPMSQAEKTSFNKLLEYDPKKERYQYRGLALGDFWHINKDYGNISVKPSYMLPESYTYNSKCIGCFPNRIMWSDVSLSEAKEDRYSVFRANNYKDIINEDTEIENIIIHGNSVYAHTGRSLYKIPTNYQEKVTSEYTLYVGTGEFMSLPEQDLGYSYELGIKSFLSSINTKHGYFFYTANGKVFHLGESLSCLSDQGLSIFFQDFGIGDYHMNAIGLNNCVILGYDNDLERVLITYRNRQSDIDGRFISGYIMPYKLDESLKDSGWIYDTTMGNKALYKRYEATYIDRKSVDMIEYDDSLFMKEAFTISYAMNVKQWMSYHSYHPYLYLSLHNKLVSIQEDKLYRHNVEGAYCTFYGIYYPYIFEYAVSNNPMTTSMYDWVKFRNKAYRGKDLIVETYNKAVFYNSTQSSSLIELTLKDNTSEWYSRNQVKSKHTVDYNERDFTLNSFRNEIGTHTRVVSSVNRVILHSDVEFSQSSANSWVNSEVLRDKYLVIRLIYDKDPSVQIQNSYVISINDESIR